MHGDQVRRAEPGERAGLVVGAVQLAVAERDGVEDLDRHGPAEPLVAGRVHGRAGPATEDLAEGVPPGEQVGTGGVRHVGGVPAERGHEPP